MLSLGDRGSRVVREDSSELRVVWGLGRRRDEEVEHSSPVAVAEVAVGLVVA